MTTSTINSDQLESDAVHSLRAAGFDAFITGSDSSLRGGVAVRVTELDARVDWTSTRSAPAPVDHNYSTYAGGVILHGGRAACDESAWRLADFVQRLIHGAARCTAS